jgi:flagellar biosynthesis/type III secretory pathway protein FliH
MAYFGGVFGPLKKQAYDEGKAEGKIEGKAEGKAEGKIEGKIEGKAEGKAEGMASLLLELLAQKFGMVPDAIKRKIETAPVEALMRWAGNMLQKNTLDEIIS